MVGKKGKQTVRGDAARKKNHAGSSKKEKKSKVPFGRPPLRAEKRWRECGVS